jgi:hypothetical protein
MKRHLVPVPAVLCAALFYLAGAGSAQADFTQLENILVKTGDTPLVHLEQTNGSGFTPQTWDVAGNEANFFIRDKTAGSRLPFRIRPGAPTNSITAAANGNVGIGLIDAATPLEIARSGVVNVRYTDTGPSPDVSWDTGIAAGGGAFTAGVNGQTPALILRSFGDLDLTGSLSEAANSTSVADVQGVDEAAILAKLVSLPIKSWRFNGAPAGARHLAPLAGDFSAAFGLGNDASRIAPADMAGISLAATKALSARNTALESRVAATETANGKLSKRVGKLAKQMKKLRKAVKQLQK